MENTLLKGESIEFDLLCKDTNGKSQICKFKKMYNRDLIVLSEFKGKVSFWRIIISSTYF